MQCNVMLSNKYSVTNELCLYQMKINPTDSVFGTHLRCHRTIERNVNMTNSQCNDSHIANSNSCGMSFNFPNNNSTGHSPSHRAIAIFTCSKASVARGLEQKSLQKVSNKCKKMILLINEDISSVVSLVEHLSMMLPQ